MGGSGGVVTYFSCAACPTVLYTECESLPRMKVLKTTLDSSSVLDQMKPIEEIYTGNRVSWCAAADGAKQGETYSLKVRAMS